MLILSKHIFKNYSAIPQFQTQSKSLFFEILQILIPFFSDGINLHDFGFYHDDCTCTQRFILDNPLQPAEWIRTWYKISCSLLRIKHTALILLDFFADKFHFLKTEVSNILWTFKSKKFQKMIFSITRVHYRSCEKINTKNQIQNMKYEIKSNFKLKMFLEHHEWWAPEIM